jgi:hypothetical protein
MKWDDACSLTAPLTVMQHESGGAVSGEKVLGEAGLLFDVRQENRRAILPPGCRRLGG